MDYANLILELEDPSLEIAHNNAKHISNVVMHSLIMDMHTLLPSQCQMLSETYDLHVAWHNVYMYQINSGHFTRPSVLCITILIFKFFKKLSCHDNNDECMLLEYMKNSHLHMTLYREVIFFSWGVIILRKVELLMIILLS